MSDRSALQRIAAILNLFVLVLTYLVLLTRGRWSVPYALALAAGVFVIAAAAVIPFAPGIRVGILHRRTQIARPGLRILIAVAPWIAVFAVIAARGLWWTQRPGALRFFAAWTVLNWSIGWSESPSWTAALEVPARRALLIIAAIFIALGIEGLAFGVSPFGCALSALLAAAGALALAVAFIGSTSACLKVFAASLATMLAVGVVEATVRVLHVGQNVQEADSREVAREFYTLTPPGAVFLNSPNVLDEFGPALIEINSLGSRGPEIAGGRADVLLLGDSMIEARQLPWEQTVGPRFQDALRDRGIDDRVVAHGMRGWSPLLEWNWYLKTGRNLHPRTVVLFVFWNDLWTAGTEAGTYAAVLDEQGRPLYFDVPVDAAWIWYKHVRVVRLAADVWQRLTVSQLRHAFTAMTARRDARGPLATLAAQTLARSLNEPPLSAAEIDALLSTPQSGLPPDLQDIVNKSFWPRVRPVELWTDTQRQAAAATELELQRFAQDVAADGGRLAIVHVPNPLQIGPDECAVGRLFERVPPGTVLPPHSGIQTWLRDVADRHHLELLDPSDAMREAADRMRAEGGGDPMYLRADCHWSVRGHQFMAGYLADWYARTARQ